MEELVQQETTNIVPKKQKKKQKKRWLILALAAVLLLAGAFVMRRMRQSATVMGEISYEEAAAERRDIVNSLTGSGTLQPADAYTVTSLVSGEVLADYFDEGDQVEEDQLLYSIDASRMENSLTQAQRSYENAVSAKYPTADMGGVVSEVYVSSGDTVSNGTKLMKIVGDNNIYMDFLFAYTAAGEFYVGQKADVFITGYEGSITGTVTGVSDGTTASSTGAMLTTVRVKAVNPGLVTGDSTATAAIGSYTSYGTSPVKISSSSIVTAEGSGKLTGFDWLPGDAVASGQRLGTITGESIDNQIENAQLSLENTRDDLDNYAVTSPISGTVIEKYTKAGDNVGTGSNSSSTLCIIYDLSYLEMTLSIDELDISKVSVGQEVQITADAVEGAVYTGVVTKTSVVGTTSGGTTVYPVTIRIDETDGLLPDMNVDAEIFLSSMENVLAIPNGALNRGNTVMITKDSPSAGNAIDREAPEGYVYVQVTAGESDDDYIEIISGLQEGDTVAYLRTTAATEMFMGGGMMGGMPGGTMGGMSGGPSGMPSGGGMPGGGGMRR